MQESSAPQNCDQGVAFIACLVMDSTNGGTLPSASALRLIDSRIQVGSACSIEAVRFLSKHVILLETILLAQDLNARGSHDPLLACYLAHLRRVRQQAVRRILNTVLEVCSSVMLSGQAMSPPRGFKRFCHDTLIEDHPNSKLLTSSTVHSMY